MEKNEKIERVLVTGGAGYIGSHIQHDLIRLGYQVVVFDNLELGSRKNISDKAEFVEGDLRNSDDLDKAFQNKIDAVFHFAAYKQVNESIVNPQRYLSNNIIGSSNLLRKCVDNDVKYFVFSSTCAVYGEPEYLPLDEEHPKNPVNYYGFTKYMFERNLEWFGRLDKIRFAALRYFNATGYDLEKRITEREMQTTNLCPVIMEVAAGIREKLMIFGTDYDTPDGTAIRDYIHVNDLSDAHLKAMNYLAEENKDLVLNLGTGKGSSVKDVLEAAEKVLEKDIPHEYVERRERDPRELFAKAVKAKKLIDWEAKNSDLETIMRSMILVYFK